MKNEDKWVPTKFVERDGAWVSSRTDVGPSSWLITDLVASAYHRAIAAHCRGRVIDVGCGSAPLYAMYRKHASSVTCIDWDNSLHNLSFCDSYVDLNRAWDGVPSDSFDTVISTDVMEHLHSPETFFSEAARVLAPGGKFILSLPFLYWIHEAPHDYLRHTEFSLRRLCRLNRLEVVELTTTGGAPEVLADMAFKMFGPGKTASKFLYYFARGMLRCPPFPRISRRTRQALPLGYVLVASKPA
ncbi:class I SAM-dependent methyltransferase [Dongia sp.]|uniref:class I SAM-dependent methyltransferase n=1 Tax=Dongia sp. TaxID=1977262 RepID=UPI0037508A7B